MAYDSPQQLDPEPEPGPDKDICNRLRALRIRYFGPRGKAKFARHLGLPLSTYCTYEADRVPGADVLVRAAEITGCAVQWLMTGTLGQVDTGELSVQEAAMVSRLTKLLVKKPQARQAIEAFMDLLGEAGTAEAAAAAQTAGGVKAAAAASGKNLADRIVIPIIGRAAAGQVAFWSEIAGSSGEGIHDLRTLAEQVLAADPGQAFDGVITTPGPPYAQTAETTVVRFPEPKQIGDVLIDGVIVTALQEQGGQWVAVQIDGESMMDVLKDGDYVIADPAQAAVAGEIALVMAEGQIGTTCKIYLIEDGEVRLVPANSAYQTVTVREDQVRFAWRVVGAIRCQ